MTTKTKILAGTALTAAVALTGASPAVAAHDTNPSKKVARYDYKLSPVQPASVPGTRATGTTSVIRLPGGKLQVRVRASGLTPNVPHAMHLHGVAGPTPDMACPGPGAAGADGVVTILDGAPFYGSILASLTTTGDTSAASGLALDFFPVADAKGNIRYNRTFTQPAAYDEADTVQVVVHGADFDGNGAYAFNADDPFASRASSIAPGVPLEATVPVLCGGIAN